jgi:hypothetical protein
MEEGLRKRIDEIHVELGALKDAVAGPPSRLLERMARVNLLVQDLRAQVHRAHHFLQGD